MHITDTIAEELAVRAAQVEAAVALLDEGATVPFIARYRKEATGGLDDGQLRTLEERLGYLRELEDRRATVIDTIREQGNLTDALEQAIRSAATKAELEDLYRPYKPRRRTRAQKAREAGLEPLADALLADPSRVPEQAAEGYLDAEQGVETVDAALDGARQILMERFAEDPGVSRELRERLWREGVLESRVVEGREQAGAKFADYFDYAEPIARIPSHRALALFRGRNEDVLGLRLDLPGAAEAEYHPAEGRIAAAFGIRDAGRPADRWLAATVRRAWRVKLHTRLEMELLLELRERAEATAIEVFGRNLRDLLLAAPAGPRVTIGLDPGLRTGVKVAVVDATGKLLETDTIYPHPPQKRHAEALARLRQLVETHGADLVAIGNGTASRETDRLVGELARDHLDRPVTRVMVSEAGASVYSASRTAAEEFPDLDVSLRGAVSIARRLQDPLAELVKIEPKAIGVGQYQHDVSQTHLARKLEAVVEDCVNAVGVDVNTASAALLAHVAGLSRRLAGNIVAHRDAHGRFHSRQALKAVSRLGDKTFEQAAGFLRIMDGENALDASAVHPEAYPVVERIAAESGRDIRALVGDRDYLRRLDPAAFTDERFGLPTVRDILGELEKPGRDPRPEFRTAEFREGVETIGDLEPDMVLEGVVTNVTHFGAFVDVGVHQDGLVHISAMSEQFVKDPHEVVAAGDVVRVKVMSVDAERKRIGLSMRLNDSARDQADAGPARGARGKPRRQSRPAKAEKPAPGGAMAAAFAKARKE